VYNLAFTRSGHLNDGTYHTSESTTMESVNSLSQAESITTKARLSVNSSEIFETNNVGGEVAPTMNANPSYERHVLQWRKNKFTMKRNEVYDTVTIP
jgi:hypothetical protein